MLVRRGLHPVPLQAAWARRRLGLADAKPLVEMKLLARDGIIYGGADALMQIARAIWWAVAIVRPGANPRRENAIADGLPSPRCRPPLR